MQYPTGSDKRFFDLWRRELVQSMTLVERLPEGDLYYYRAPQISLAVWVFVGERSVLVVYVWRQDRERTLEKVHVWHRALRDRNAPAQFLDLPYEPVYAAEESAETGDLYVACFHPGDWCGLASERNRPLAQARTHLPPGWPESCRARIGELAAGRSDAGPLPPVGR